MRLRRRASVVALLLLLLVGLSASTAAAQNDKAASEELYKQGKAALDAQRIDEACPKLEESLRLDFGLGTLINLALCHELQGKTATAWAEYTEVAERGGKEGGQTERVETARKLADALAPKLARLRLVVRAEPEPGLVVKRDGVVVGLGSLDTPLPIDPGDRVITASAPGFEPYRTVVHVARTPDTTTITIPALKAGESTGTDGSLGLLGAGATIGAVGLAGLVVGAAFGVMTLDDASEAESDPMLCADHLCTPAGREKIDGAYTKALVSNITLGVGAGLLATGIVLITFDRVTAANVRPTAGPGEVGLGIALDF